MIGRKPSIYRINKEEFISAKQSPETRASWVRIVSGFEHQTCEKTGHATPIHHSIERNISYYTSAAMAEIMRARRARWKGNPRRENKEKFAWKEGNMENPFLLISSRQENHLIVLIHHDFIRYIDTVQKFPDIFVLDWGGLLNGSSWLRDSF